jgi:hypothetical protein
VHTVKGDGFARGKWNLVVPGDVVRGVPPGASSGALITTAFPVRRDPFRPVPQVPIDATDEASNDGFIRSMAELAFMASTRKYPGTTLGPI